MTRKIGAVAVFSGSNFGRGEAYRNAAAALGTEIATRGIKLVYGGTHMGLMGVLADATLAAGGEVHGVITQRLLAKEHLHPRITRHEIVDTMRQRKARMAELADAFIALPGGIGTLEEFMEVWTLNQLGEIAKPAGLMDAGGFYGPFMHFIDHMIEEQFLPASHRGGIVVEPDAGLLLDGLERFVPVAASKWMSTK